jgi:molybdopterin synthase sulfur carrier subunit
LNIFLQKNSGTPLNIFISTEPILAGGGLAVTVKFFAGFREAAGKDQEKVEGVADVGSLLDELVRKFGKKMRMQLYEPGTRKILGTTHILVNGRSINLLEGLKTPLKDGDVVAIFPPVAGGGIETCRDCSVCKGV